MIEGDLTNLQPFSNNQETKKEANIQNILVNERASTTITPPNNQANQNNEVQEENIQPEDIQGTSEEGIFNNFHNTNLPEINTIESNPIIEERRRLREIKISFSHLTYRVNRLYQICKKIIESGLDKSGYVRIALEELMKSYKKMAKKIRKKMEENEKNYKS